MQVIVICTIINIRTRLTPRLAIIIGNDTRRGTSPSCVSEVSSFILMISLPSSEVVRHVSQHELGTTFSRSGLFCNTITTNQSKLCCIMTQTSIISLQQSNIFIYGRSDNAIGTSEHILIWSINHITTVTTLHVCTVHQQYKDTILLLQTDAHNYKIIGILKQLKFRLSLRHVSVQGAVSCSAKTTNMILCACCY